MIDRELVLEYKPNVKYLNDPHLILFDKPRLGWDGKAKLNRPDPIKPIF